MSSKKLLQPSRRLEILNKVWLSGVAVSANPFGVAAVPTAGSEWLGPGNKPVFLEMVK